MPGIPPKVACHHLVLDPKTKWVAQKRRVHKGKKVVATTRAVKDLIEAVFVKEIRYTT